MSDDPTTTRPAPNPRLLLAFIALIMTMQAVYAGFDLFGGAGASGAPGTAGTPLQVLLTAGFLAYVAMIVVFAFGVWRETWWAWHLAVAIAATGLGLAALRIAGGETFEQQALGMVIDGALLFYLQRPSIKALFGR